MVGSDNYPPAAADRPTSRNDGVATGSTREAVDPTTTESTLTVPPSASSNGNNTNSNSSIINEKDGNPPSLTTKDNESPIEEEKGQEENHENALHPQISTTSEIENVSSRVKLVIVTALCMNLFLAALDQTIVTTALPRVIEELGDARGYAWCGSAFLIASASFIACWGKLSDIWGRKPIIMIASIIFMVGSVVSGAARNMGMLLAGRTVQGFGAGGIISLVNITISDIVTLRERGKYLALVGFTWALAGAVGPVIGGALTDHASWRWCFYLNLPVGGVAMAVILYYLHLDSPKVSIKEGLAKVDWLGCFVSVAAVVLFLVGLEMGGVQYAWSSAVVLVCILLGLALWALFLAIELKFAKYPIMPMRLFTHKTNIAAYFVTFLHGQAFIAACFYIPLYFQACRGIKPLMSGVLTLPLAMLLSLSSAVTGGVIAKTGKYQALIWTGCVMMAAGTGAFVDLDRTSAWPKYIFYQVIAGIGFGPLFQGPLIAIHSTINPKDIGTATAAFAFIRSVSSAIGVTIGGVIFQNAIEKHQPYLRSVAGARAAEAASGRQAAASVQFVQSLPERARHAIQDAYAEALSEMWWYFFAVSCLALVVSLFIGKHHLSTKLQSSQPVKNRKDRKSRDMEKEVGKEVA